jgi:LmbE family N-acetylglucosaminyl deacetylase
MLSFSTKLRVLGIGAHPDDLEIGAGGFIHRLRKEADADVWFLILSPGLESWNPREEFSRLERVEDASRGAAQLNVPKEHVEVWDREDCNLHRYTHEIIRKIEAYLYDPRRAFDLVLTHAPGDTHQDHRSVAEATISAARQFHGTILFYQAPSTTLNDFNPNFRVPLDAEDIDAKDAAIMAHVSQRSKAFTRRQRTVGMAASWAMFHRQPDAMLEVFRIFQSCWNGPLA